MQLSTFVEREEREDDMETNITDVPGNDCRAHAPRDTVVTADEGMSRNTTGYAGSKASVQLAMSASPHSSMAQMSSGGSVPTMPAGYDSCQSLTPGVDKQGRKVSFNPGTSSRRSSRAGSFAAAAGMWNSLDRPAVPPTPPPQQRFLKNFLFRQSTVELPHDPSTGVIHMTHWY